MKNIVYPKHAAKNPNTNKHCNDVLRGLVYSHFSQQIVFQIFW